MRNTLKYIGLALVAATALISCDSNDPSKFDDKDAFVAFDKTSVSLSEDFSSAGAVYKIPVTLASVKGLEETVKFEVVSPETKGAKEGVNFEVLTSSGVLSFNAENRTQYIEIKTIYDGVYTGDLQFSINLVGTESVPAGSEGTCTVTINDIDHPLSFMLGSYKMSGVKYPSTPNTWTMTILKDAKDDHMVWFDNLFGNSGWVAEDMRYYGTVNADHTILTIPFGQTSVYKYSNGNPVTLYGLNSDLDAYDSGSVDVKIITEGGKVTLDFGKEWGLWFYIKDAGGIGTYLPGLSAIKD